jgi:oligopeptide transport system permease protein
MPRIFARRLINAGIIMVALVVIAFALLCMAAGGPFAAHPAARPELLAELARAFPPDRPLYEQFGRYLWGALHLDFGPTFNFRDYRVADLLFRGAPISVEIVFWALLAAFIIGVPLGSVAARRRGSVLDRAILTLALIGLAVPVFVIGIGAQLVFGVVLRWVPIAGWDGGAADKLLPVAVLALPLIAVIIRLSRHRLSASDDGTLRGGRFAGLAAAVSQLGPLTAGALMAAIVIERGFSLPGTGRYLVEAARIHDDTLLSGAIIFYGGLIVLAGLLGDFGGFLLGRWSTGATAPAVPPAPGSAPRQRAWAILRRDRTALAAAIMILAIAAICLLAPMFSRTPWENMDYAAVSTGPSWTSGHLLGADDLGRDRLSGLLLGGGNSLLLGAGAALIAALILAGWRGIAAWFPRFGQPAARPGVGLFEALPFLVLALVAQGELIRFVFPNTIAIASLVWLVLAVARHSKVPIVLAACLAIPDAILGEAYLSCLDAGMQEPTVTWGSLIAAGQQSADMVPSGFFVPVTALVVTVLALNLLAQRVRAAVAPG